MIAVLFSKWMLAMNSGKKIGLYDRINAKLLMKKLARTGLSPSWLAFIESYHAPREAVVVVEGARSEPFIIADMVFQGNVLGPMLWNVCFADISTFIASIGYDEERFADDVRISSLSFINVKNQFMNEDGHTKSHSTRARTSSLSSMTVWAGDVFRLLGPMAQSWWDAVKSGSASTWKVDSIVQVNTLLQDEKPIQVQYFTHP